ncbi:MAG: site-2 protease family protein [Candidatus Marinimicrobia bacterium]|nr:site-2 protease family protein [Candidatus Neomarinimicrobiota bacterium]
MATLIDTGIEALANVAIIEGRGKVPGGEVVYYRLLAGSAEGSERLALSGLGLEIGFSNAADDRMFVVMREKATGAMERPSRLHVGLFIATVLTTLMAGALLEGHNIFTQPWMILAGWPFSLTLMAILGCHESGHYFYARKHQVDVSLPYFIPVPPPITFIGTFGAFIRIRGLIPNRLALLEIGAAGPIAGFLVAVPALLIGLEMSSVVNLEGGEFILGDSLLLKAASAIVFPSLGPEEDILLHPVAFAGWIGLLVTMLNLLPLAQLDGGHISYALLGRRQVLVGRIVIVALVPMGIFLSPNWLLWAALILIMMRTVRHPPIHGIDHPLSRREVVIGLVCLLIFILCFIPVPFAAS